MATPAAKIPMLISSLVDRFHHACRAHPLRKLNTRPRSSSPRNVSTTARPNDFSLSANPASLTLNQNSTGTSAISTAVTSGNPQTVNLTVGGCPSGASCTVSPTSITSGNGSTLTINSGTAAGGTYTVTVTGAGTSNTHSTTVALTVNGPPPPDDFSISANPNSLTVNQGASGNSTISTSVTSGNPQSVTLSSSGCAERRELHLRHQPDPVRRQLDADRWRRDGPAGHVHHHCHRDGRVRYPLNDGVVDRAGERLLHLGQPDLGQRDRGQSRHLDHLDGTHLGQRAVDHPQRKRHARRHHGDVRNEPDQLGRVFSAHAGDVGHHSGRDVHDHRDRCRLSLAKTRSRGWTMGDRHESHGAQCPSYSVGCSSRGAQNPHRPHTREPSAPAAARPAPPQIEATEIRATRSRLLDVALAAVDTVERSAPCRKTADGNSLAPAELSRFLDLEDPPRASGSTTGQRGACGSCAYHGAGEPALGRATHPRRIAEARVRRLAAHRGAAYAASPETTIADMEDVPPKPRRRPCLSRFLRRADCDIPNPLRVRGPAAPSPASRALQRHGLAHCRLDGAANCRSLSRRFGATLSPPRSRQHLRWRVSATDEGHVHRRGSLVTTLPLAEPLRRTSHRHPPP